MVYYDYYDGWFIVLPPLNIIKLPQGPKKKWRTSRVLQRVFPAAGALPGCGLRQGSAQLEVMAATHLDLDVCWGFCTWKTWKN